MSGVGRTCRRSNVVRRVCLDEINRLGNIETVIVPRLNEIGELIRVYPRPFLNIRLQLKQKVLVLIVIRRLTIHEIFFLYAQHGEVQTGGQRLGSSLLTKTKDRTGSSMGSCRRMNARCRRKGLRGLCPSVVRGHKSRASMTGGGGCLCFRNVCFNLVVHIHRKLTFRSAEVKSYLQGKCHEIGQGHEHRCIQSFLPLVLFEFGEVINSESVFSEVGAAVHFRKYLVVLHSDFQKVQ